MKIFMTGASGYIGGTWPLADQSRPFGSGLARTKAAAAKLRARHRAVHGDLSSHSVVRDAARAADAVINCANAANPFVAAAILEGLAGSGKALLHTSGSSIVGDKAAGKFSQRVHHEDTPSEPLPEKVQRVAVHRAVLSAAAQGVRSVVFCPRLIYGGGEARTRKASRSQPDPPGGQKRRSALHRRGRERLVHGAHRRRCRRLPPGARSGACRLVLLHRERRVEPESDRRVNRVLVGAKRPAEELEHRRGDRRVGAAGGLVLTGRKQPHPRRQGARDARLEAFRAGAVP